MEFPKGYFQEETRDGFTISEMMKRAWGAEFELLEIVARICDKYGLTYYAIGGTLLGAVRHKGFIPWDDDIDITLLRSDYNKLIEVLPTELPAGIVIAGMYAGNERLQKANNFPHLRVIADEEYWSFPAYLKRFHGFPYPRIGIDIFPRDYLTPDMKLRKFQFFAYHTINFTLQNWELYIQEGLLEKQLYEIEAMCEVTLDRNSYLPTQLWLLLDQIAQLADPSQCNAVVNLQYAAEGDAASYQGEPIAWFSGKVMLPFEHTTIAAPVGYREFLANSFGDYMKPVKFASEHGYPFYQKQEAELSAIFAAQGIDTPVDEFCHNWQKLTGEE